jgi:hypothetical protein
MNPTGAVPTILFEDRSMTWRMPLAGAFPSWAAMEKPSVPARFKCTRPATMAVRGISAAIFSVDRLTTAAVAPACSGWQISVRGRRRHDSPYARRPDYLKLSHSGPRASRAHSLTPMCGLAWLPLRPWHHRSYPLRQAVLVGERYCLSIIPAFHNTEINYPLAELCERGYFGIRPRFPGLSPIE